MEASDIVRSLYPRLIEGDVGVALSSFTNRATIDSPLGGRQLPPQWISAEGSWLRAHSARTEEVSEVVTPDRIAHELVLWVTIDGTERDVPIVLVADIKDDRIRDLRVYHSTWAINGRHLQRGPVVDTDPDLHPAEPVGTYKAALAAGDADAIDALFEDDGYVREPAGSEYTHRGAERAEWYRSILSAGPLPLKLGSITDDGERVVFEYTGDQWGRFPLPPQAGAAAYRRSSAGKIAYVHIYDDFDPPAELFE